MHYIPTQNRVVEFWEKCQELYEAINLEYSNVAAVESASIFMLYKPLKEGEKGIKLKGSLYICIVLFTIFLGTA